MTGKRGKWRIRIKKMKPEPITLTKRNAWGEKEKKTVWGTLLLSFICITWYCNSRNQPNEDNDDDDIPTRDPDLEQIQIETVDGHPQASTRGHQYTSPSSRPQTAMPVGGSDNGIDNMYPNILEVLAHIGMHPSSTQERFHRLLSPLPGATEPELPSFINAAAMASASPLPPIMENNHDIFDSCDLEVTSVASRESLDSIPKERQEMGDKEKKRYRKKKQPKDTSIAKIPSVKKWTKQEEKKRKAEKKQQKKELEKDKKKQKEMEKRIAKANKLKEYQKDKELKKAEKEATKTKKVAAKAEKAAAKAKEVADKAEAKKKEKKAKLEQRLQQVLEESDRQLTAGLEKVEVDFEERKRKRENKAKKMLMSIARTEETIKTLQEKVDGKEKRITQLSEKRDRIGHHASMLVIFKVHYKINDYKRRIYTIKNVITKLKKKVEAKKKETERLAPHLLETGDTTETQDHKETRACSPNSDCNDSEVADDDRSILDMLCGLDSDSECSDDEDKELAAPKEGSADNVQDILQKAQESLQKMEEP